MCYDKETKTSTNKIFIQIHNQHTLFCIIYDDKSFNKNANLNIPNMKQYQ